MRSHAATLRPSMARNLTITPELALGNGVLLKVA